MKKLTALALALCLMLLTGGAFAQEGGQVDLDALLDKLAFEVEKAPAPAKEVVYLSGTWYEMGVQYAAIAPDAVKRVIVEGINEVQLYGAGFDACYAIVEKYIHEYKTTAPELLELYQGVADALGVEFKAMMVGVCGYSFSEQDLACSNATAWGECTEDGRTIVGSNWDTGLPNVFYEPMVVAYPDEGNAFVSSNAFRCSCAMNIEGLAMTGSSGQSAGEGDNDGAARSLPLLSGYVLNAARHTSAQDVVDANIASGKGGGNNSCHDAQGNHLMLEMTDAHHAVRRSGDFGEKDYLIASNDFMAEEMLSSLLPPGSGYDDCRPRYWTMEQIFLENFANVSLETVARAIGSNSFYMDGEWTHDNWSLETGLNSPENVSPFFQNMLKTICDPQNNAMYVMNGCGNTLVSTLPWASGNYVQVVLKDDPFDVNAQARSTANMLIYLGGDRIAHAEGDVAQRTEQLNQAKQAMLNGDTYTTLAGTSKDTVKRLAYLSRATSQYTKAQSLAQQAMDDPYAILNLA